MNFWIRILNFFLPPHCPICRKEIMDDHSVCGKCFSELSFISGHTCTICGKELPKGLGKVCGRCLKTPPYFHKTISVLKYNKISKNLILAYKHADKLDLAPLFVKWLNLKGSEIIKENDLLVPVPLHTFRLLKRKYNQSAVLAQKLAKIHHKKYTPLILKRVKNTASQGHLNRQKRKENIKGAFMVKNTEQIKGKKILLIDDVYTSGATLNECAKALIKAGAKQVDCLTLCRAGNK